ncbi:MAG TPA: hypothetical protein VFP65_14440 [Anaeromyxobacteraceae bacterium]|nr:hypothetical protein [Anaeromyxobacteraceae bacterium]
MTTGAPVQHLSGWSLRLLTRPITMGPVRKESARRRLARTTAHAHRAVAKATRTILRANRSRIGPLNELARAYLDEADAEEDAKVAEGLRRHAAFAQKFVSLTHSEIAALEHELERTAIEARIAQSRSRGQVAQVAGPRALRAGTAPAVRGEKVSRQPRRTPPG